MDKREILRRENFHMKKMQVFISSTYKDLIEERQTAV